MNLQSINNVYVRWNTIQINNTSIFKFKDGTFKTLQWVGLRQKSTCYTINVFSLKSLKIIKTNQIDLILR